MGDAQLGILERAVFDFSKSDTIEDIILIFRRITNGEVKSFNRFGMEIYREAYRIHMEEKAELRDNTQLNYYKIKEKKNEHHTQELLVDARKQQETKRGRIIGKDSKS